MKKLILIISILFFFPSVVFSAPNIVNVSGNIVDGSQIIINGYDFASHADNNLAKNYLPYGFDNLESGMVDDDLFDCSAFGSELVSDETNKSGSSFSARAYHWGTLHAWTSVCGIERTAQYQYRGNSISLGGAKDKVFFSVWYYIPEGYIDNLLNDSVAIPPGHKFLYLDYANSTEKTYFSHGDSGAYAHQSTNTEDGALSVPEPLLNWVTEGSWHRYDVYVDLRPEAGAKIHKWYIDGKLVRDGFYNAGFNYLIDFVAPIGYYPTSSDDLPHMHHWDDYFIDFTLARVEISNHATWDESEQHHKEIQIPTNWLADSINFTFNQGSFNNGDTAYLYVVDENGEVNANGYPIAIGSDSADTTAPNAPTNLSVL